MEKLFESGHSKIKHRFLRRVEVPKRKRKTSPTCISLFSGCGGMDLGFREAGFEIRAMVEWDKDACDVLRLNWTMDGIRRAHGGKPPKWYQKREPAILERDITKLPTSEILEAAGLEVGEADAVTGGFPCQGFSMARGKRYIDDPRNQLYKECVRVVREALPRSFCFENVPGLANMDEGRVIKQICDDLAASGYNVRWDILDAADYGVPQRRKRVFFIGSRVDFLVAAEPRPRLHLAAFAGCVQYPEWFIEKYPHLGLGAQMALPFLPGDGR